MDRSDLDLFERQGTIVIIRDRWEHCEFVDYNCKADDSKALADDGHDRGHGWTPEEEANPDRQCGDRFSSP